MSRILMVMLFAVAGVLMTGVARATTVTYDLTLSDTLYGPENGTGFLTVNAPVTTGAFTSSPGGGLTFLSIAIDGQTYNLANAVGTAEATFVNGSLSNLSYLGISDGINLSLASTGLFYFYTDLNNWSLSSAGTISAMAAPLPPTAVLFAGALVVFLLFGYRQGLFRRRKFRTGLIPLG